MKITSLSVSLANKLGCLSLASIPKASDGYVHCHVRESGAFRRGLALSTVDECVT